MDAVSRLQNVYFLEHLAPEEFEALAGMMHLEPFVTGDKILSQGEPTTNFYLVDEGYVNLRHTDKTGFEKAIGSKGPGDFFGVKMFTTQEESEYTFEAVGTAKMWVVERRDWDALLERFPAVLEHMPELRAEYVRLTRGLDWLAPGEVIDLLTRRHKWALLLMVRGPLLLAAVFTFALWISFQFGVAQQLSWVLPVYGIVMFFCLLWTVWSGLNWWNDKYIVTNKRAIRINQILFFSDSREEIAIEKIQSQLVERGGPISVLLNISDLRLTSAASHSGGVVFQQVGDVLAIQRIIDGERAKVGERRSASERERLRTQIAGEIRHYVFQQPNAPEKPMTPAQSPTLATRFGIIWASLFGTEFRNGKVVTWRKHRIILLRQVGVYLAVLLALLACTGVFTFYGTGGLEFAQTGVYLGLGVFIIAALAGVIWQWLDWRVDLYRLTETQIVDIESWPFGLRYNENKADLSKIQDVNTARPHFINTLLDYGNVVTHVAGNADPFTFNSVARPRVVADEISERIMLLQLAQVRRATQEQTRNIVDAIVAYHRLMVSERTQSTAAPPAAVLTPAESASEIAPPPPLAPHPSFEDEGEFPPETHLGE